MHCAYFLLITALFISSAHAMEQQESTQNQIIDKEQIAREVSSYIVRPYTDPNTQLATDLATRLEVYFHDAEKSHEIFQDGQNNYRTYMQTMISPTDDDKKLAQYIWAFRTGDLRHQKLHLDGQKKWWEVWWPYRKSYISGKDGALSALFGVLTVAGVKLLAELTMELR